MGRPSGPLTRAVRARVVGTVGVAVVGMLAAVGCQSTSPGGQPILTDAREIVMAGIRSTAALATVHVRIELALQVPAGDALGAPDRGGRQTVDIDIDLPTRNFVARAVMTAPGEPDQTSEIVLVDGRQFTRNPPAARWTQFPNFGPQQPLPTNEQIVASVAGVIESAGAVLQLADPEACGDGTCYHVIAELDPAATWQLIGPILMGAQGNGPPPAGFELPPITVHLYVDQASSAGGPVRRELRWWRDPAGAGRVALTALSNPCANARFRAW